uniref:N-acetyltransferase domain-containing protein n=1 Tax=Strigamia maritima TaxID=126957 RepID=T1JB23_STRMM
TIYFVDQIKQNIPHRDFSGASLQYCGTAFFGVVALHDLNSQTQRKPLYPSIWAMLLHTTFDNLPSVKNNAHILNIICKCHVVLQLLIANIEKFINFVSAVAAAIQKLKIRRRCIVCAIVPEKAGLSLIKYNNWLSEWDFVSAQPLETYFLFCLFRFHSLEKSCDKLPCSLVLIDHTGPGLDEIIGHSRITPIHGHKQACLLESVLVEKEKRGKGFGKLIMKETEEFAKKLGINTVYLSTKDKQEFYKRIGYEFCEPLCVYGNNIKLPTKTVIKFKEISSVTDESVSKNPQSQIPQAPPLPESIHTNNNEPKKQANYSYI